MVVNVAQQRLAGSLAGKMFAHLVSDFGGFALGSWFESRTRHAYLRSFRYLVTVLSITILRKAIVFEDMREAGLGRVLTGREPRA